MNQEEKIIKFKEITKTEFFKRKKELKATWEECCKMSIIPEFILEEFVEEINWDIICTHQVLSENFIRKFKTNVNWKLVTKFQKISEPFIEEMSNHVDWFSLIFSRELSQEFLIKHEDKFEIWINNWHKQLEEKGSLTSMRSWFDNSIDGSIYKQTLLRNLLKIGYVCIWDSHYEEIQEEDLDYFLEKKE